VTAARAMTAHKIKWLPVVDPDGALVGIVTRGDLLKAFVRPDAELAAEARAVLTEVLLVDPAAVTVTVRNGVVTLEGQLDSEPQIAAARRLTETIDGVVNVRSYLTAPPPAGFPGGGYHLPA